MSVHFNLNRFASEKESEPLNYYPNCLLYGFFYVLDGFDLLYKLSLNMYGILQSRTTA